VSGNSIIPKDCFNVLTAPGRTTNYENQAKNLRQFVYAQENLHTDTRLQRNAITQINSIKLNPNSQFGPEWDYTFNLELAQINSDQGNYNEVHFNLDDAQAINPTDPQGEISSLRIKTYLRQGPDHYDTAKRILMDNIEQNPDSPGNKTAAVDFNTAMAGVTPAPTPNRAIEPEAMTIFTQGIESTGIRDYNAALEKFDAASNYFGSPADFTGAEDIATKVFVARTLNLKASTLTSLSNFPDAVSTLKQSLGIIELPDTYSQFAKTLQAAPSANILL